MPPCQVWVIASALSARAANCSASSTAWRVSLEWAARLQSETASMCAHRDPVVVARRVAWHLPEADGYAAAATQSARVRSRQQRIAVPPIAGASDSRIPSPRPLAGRHRARHVR